MTVCVPTSPSVCFCSTWGNQIKQNTRWNDKNVDKFRLSWSLVPKSQSITRFDCRAAVCLPCDVKKCLWIHEATGEVWMSLEHNITAVNKWRNRLHVCDCTNYWPTLRSSLLQAAEKQSNWI